MKNPDDTTLSSLLRDNGLKATPGRLALLEAMRKVTGPVSYEDLKATLSMDKATFYRNMQQFEKQKLVTAFEAHDRRRYYELASRGHAHFVCTDCSQIECLHEVSNPILPGRKVDGIVIQGQCEACAKDDPA